MKFFDLISNKNKNKRRGPIVPEYRGYTPPPMPKTAPCKPENDFPDFDMLHDKAKDVSCENSRKSFDRLIDRLSADMKESALHGSFQSCLFLRQADYTGLDLSDPDSIDCQDIRDYILSKDSRFTVIIEPLDEVYKDVLSDDCVKLTVKWCVEKELLNENANKKDTLF